VLITASDGRPVAITGEAFLHFNYATVSSIATALGMHEVAAHYTQRAAGVRDRMNSVYRDSQGA
jgi:hypothetical protein